MEQFYNIPNLSMVADIRDKAAGVEQYIRYMLNRTQRMFEYTGLPSSIPAKSLEMYLQTVGYCAIYPHNGNLYAGVGGLGGMLNEYYLPTIITIANPYLKLSKTFTIGEDCVVILNDSTYTGLLPMYRRYASLLVDNDITMRQANINTRAPALISADDDVAAKSAEIFLKRLDDGKQGIISKRAFLDGIQTAPFGTVTANYQTQNIEYEQYLKAGWLNDIGIEANGNAKREALADSEVGANQTALLPLIDDMEVCRTIGIEEVNEMFGTSISVARASIWKQIEEEVTQPAEEENPEEQTEEETNEDS